MTKTENKMRLEKLVKFFKENNFNIVWMNGSSIRMDRTKNNRLEVVYIPVSPFCRMYSDIHFLNNAR